MNKYKEGIATIHNNLRKLLNSYKRGLKAWEICDIYLRRFKIKYSDSAMTARLREMADVVCNLSNYTYSIGGK